ncbi:MAG: DUF86 domain-containing protein [Desulfurococcales archaeon]|nr:DUF86 domain-containing protein [Desulfurococcales archaeon]
MLHRKLLETISSHVELLDSAKRRGIDWSDTLQVYAVLHALQVHAQAVIDYLLHTCAILGISVETPMQCIYMLRQKKILSDDNADQLKRLVRFRNIVVHEYGVIDIDKVKRILENRGYHQAMQIIQNIHQQLQDKQLLDP